MVSLFIDYEEVERFLIGSEKYSVNEARKVSYREYLIRKEQKVIDDTRLWEAVRYMVFMEIQGNPYITKDKKPKRVESLFTLPTDKPRPKPRECTDLTEREMERLRKVGLIK